MCEKEEEKATPMSREDVYVNEPEGRFIPPPGKSIRIMNATRNQYDGCARDDV